MTVAIAFNAGTYGTYLEWCLTNLTTNKDLESPFTQIGNSHKFKGTHLLDIIGCRNFLSAGSTAPFIRFHPKTVKDHNLSDNLDYVCQHVESVIYLYPDVDHVVFCLNNYMSKIFDDWWSDHFINTINYDKIYNNWPINPGVTMDKIPQWIKREFLSYYLMPAWFDQIEWYHPNKWHNTKACVITTKDLLFDFESTMGRIQQHCNLNYTKPVSSLISYHNENLELQANKTQDQICNQIIDSVLDETNFDWRPLPFGSEVWVQWELRNRGFEIRCDGLDIFPTNSVHLKELLYPL